MPKISPCFVDDINRALMEAHLCAVSHKFCTLFWLFNMPDNIDKVFLLNPNIEIRNPKQYQNPNVKNLKQMQITTWWIRKKSPKLVISSEARNLCSVTHWKYKISPCGRNDIIAEFDFLRVHHYLDFIFFLIFGFLSLEFVSYFDIRISEFPVSDKWIKCNHFERISFCQFGILNLWDGALGISDMRLRWWLCY